MVRRWLGLGAMCVLCGATAELSGQQRNVALPRSAVVVNDGVPGESSTELRARFKPELAQWKPQFVVIYTGMNDAVNDRKFSSVEALRANVQGMLDEARSAGATPLLVAIQSVDEVRLLQRHSPDAYGSRKPNDRIADRNAVLEELAVRDRVALVRFDRVLQAAGGPNAHLSTDGVHLSADGYKLLAAAVWKALAKQWRSGDVVLCLGDSLTFGQGVRPQGAGLLDEKGRPFPTYPEDLKELAAQALPDR